MKKLILLAILFIGLEANAQIAFTWNPSQTLIETVDANAYTQIYIYQDNQTADTLELETEIIYTNVPVGWDGMICVQGMCLGGIPAVGTITSMSPVSGAVPGYVRWTVNPMGSFDSGEIQVRVYDKNNPSDGDTCTFIITGAPLGIQDYGTAGDFYAFPNPATEVINIANNEGIDQFQLFSPDGKMIEQINSSDEMISIAIEDLPAGVYFLHGLTEGILIGTRKIVVR